MGQHVPSGTMGRDKEQCIGTPLEHCNAVYRFFDGEPDLDPFGMPGQVLRAARILLRPEHWAYLPARRARTPGCNAFVKGDAWVDPWVGKVYGNPPFEALGQAFATALEAAANGAEVLLLVPLRTHRTYWHLAWQAQAICYLAKPVEFLGYEHGFSMPCVYLYFGPRGRRFVQQFSDLGRCEVLTPRPRSPTMPSVSTIKAIIDDHMVDGLRDAFAANGRMTLSEFFETAGWELDGDEYRLLMNTPIDRLFSAVSQLEPDSPAPQQAYGAPPVVHTGPNGSNGRKPTTVVVRGKKTAKKKATASAKTKRGGVDEYVKSKKKGDTFKTEQYGAWQSVTGQTARRQLHESKKVKKRGDKRAAYWEVVK